MPVATITYPERIPLAHLPTPLEPLRRLSKELGVELWIKRDDLTGMALSGNKIRKLEFSFAAARAQGADVVLTCGGAQSNHARATAVSAARLGLNCRLLLRTADPGQPPPLSGNILLDHMAGAEIVWITPEAYREREIVFAREAAKLRRAGRTPFIIPEGASDAVGAWGYIRAMAELAEGMDSAGILDGRPTTIVAATGSGGTVAGLLLGAKLLNLSLRIACINVCDNADYFQHVIGDICTTCIQDYDLNLSIDMSADLEIVDGYVGRGYAFSQPEELALICEVARKEGLFLDPVYTGKAFYGMVSELAKDSCCFGERIVFIHTGGLFGLFPVAEEIAELC